MRGLLLSTLWDPVDQGVVQEGIGFLNRMARPRKSHMFADVGTPGRTVPMNIHRYELPEPKTYQICRLYYNVLTRNVLNATRIFSHPVLMKDPLFVECARRSENIIQWRRRKTRRIDHACRRGWTTFPVQQRHLRRVPRTDEYVGNDVIHLWSERFDPLNVMTHSNPVATIVVLLVRRRRRDYDTQPSSFHRGNAHERTTKPVSPLCPFRRRHIGVDVEPSAGSTSEARYGRGPTSLAAG
mmetsp:Transcript_8095/g.14891  ORF Transcript_8095/g.14891 Transcript_8095/m.14891 type:complete len:240 (-) Transcript_8095:797-1516(-)